MRLTTVATPEAVHAKSAEGLALLLRDALARRGVAHFALTGGSSAGPVYTRLAGMLESWDGVHLWWGDERCVAPDDDEANFKIAVGALIEPAGIGADFVHRMRGELGPDAGAEAYAAELSEHVEARADDGMPVLDVIDLGLGPDGHVCSLFPEHPALDVAAASVVGIADSPKPPPERVTLTLPVLRAARRCLLHTSGADRRDAIDALLGEPSPATPASLLERARLTVVIDDAAAGQQRPSA